MDNLSEIISSLSDDDINMLKSVAGSLLGESEPAPAPKETALSEIRGLGTGDLQMIMKAKRILEKMNTSGNKNAELINALKPHLSERSRGRADEAIRIMQLFEALPYIKELF